MKISRILSALVLSQIVFATSVMAVPTVSLTGGPYQFGSGGEFTAAIGNGGTAGLAEGYIFQTFCLETGEGLSLDGRDYYFEVNTAAVSGGAGSGGSDPLDPSTAWLYNEFIEGALTGYDFVNPGPRLADANNLQQALWYMEGEVTSISDDAQAFVDLASGKSLPGGIGDIRVLNLYTDPSLDIAFKAQDVLVKTTPPAVPAPGALLLSAIGTSCVGYFRRRRAA